jgi:hypothetical protein
MISAGKRWRRYIDTIGRLSPNAVNLTELFGRQRTARAAVLWTSEGMKVVAREISADSQIERILQTLPRH